MNKIKVDQQYYNGPADGWRHNNKKAPHFMDDRTNISRASAKNDGRMTGLFYTEDIPFHYVGP